MSKYMFLLIISGIVPFILSFWPALRFYLNWKALLFTTGLIVIIFGGWDIIATARGHWSFSREGVWSIRIINLPLEEVLFFVVIPFCCIFTWEVIKFIRTKIK